ncbi:MAG: hypothetical protein EBX66_05920, partial [Betaproteobacteria bacterium]|nr:hypothetical protein [Betaproteobacteria bacterium]
SLALAAPGNTLVVCSWLHLLKGRSLLKTRGGSDIALASFFRNAYFARWTIDGQRWPKVANWLSEVLAHESFAKLSRFEEISLRTPIEKHRSALAEAGAPISEASFFSPSPRRGILVI